MKHLFIALAVLAATLFAAPAQAEDPVEVGSLYAFSVQPEQSPTGVGYVQINYVDGVTWYMDGQEVTVTYPSTKFPQPGGFQSDVYAVPLPGYQVTSDVQGTQDRPYWLTVNATPTTAVVLPTVKTPAPKVKHHRHHRHHRHHKRNR